MNSYIIIRNIYRKLNFPCTYIFSEQTDRELAESNYERNIEELEARIQANAAKFKSREQELEMRLNTLRDYADHKEENEKALGIVSVFLQ